MNNILVIGGSGYIGTVLIPKLLKNNYNVINIDNLIYGHSDKNIDFVKKNKIKTKYRHLNLDIRKTKKLKFELNKFKFHGVVILAGLVGDPITKKYSKLSREINRTGIKNCIKLFEKINLRLIFVSTCSNYGLRNERPAKENSILKPLSLYSKDKVFIEQFLKNGSKKNKFSYTILRFATAFGISPKMRFDLSISDFTHQMYFKKNIKVYDQNTWRPYCHVNDFARVILLVLKKEIKLIRNQIFNVGSDENNYTKKKIVQEILKKKIKSTVSYLKNDIDPRNYIVSFAKIKKILKFKAKYSVKYGINELINNFKLDKFKNIKKLGNFKIKKISNIS